MSLPKIRVLIADDHALVRFSIRALLNSQPDMEVVASAVDGEDAVFLAETIEPDVIVMDITMPEMDGIHATEKIRALDPTSKIVILSLHADGALVRQAKDKGANGFVSKQNASDQLPEAVRTVYGGGRFFKPAASDSSFVPYPREHR